MKVFSYYNYALTPNLVARVNAENINAADAIVKSLGFNPTLLSCSIGVNVVFINTDKIKRTVLDLKRHDYYYSSGVVKKLHFDSYYNALKVSKQIYIDYDKIFLEYPSMSRYNQYMHFYPKGKEMDNFIESNGQTPDLSPDTQVEVVFRNGGTSKASVKTWVWSWYNPDTNNRNFEIVAYKVIV
jgi:hypothetical protein